MCRKLKGVNYEITISSTIQSPSKSSYIMTLRDISAVTSGYSLINMYLSRFECKKGYKRYLYFN